jgi:flagellar assembly protein FliH
MPMKPRMPVYNTQDDAPHKLPGHNPVFYAGQHVTHGQPLELDANEELTQGVQASLEILAKNHLMEAEQAGLVLLADSRKQCDKLLSKTQKTAERMMEDATQRVDEIKEQAYEEGFKSGFSEGYDEATRQVAEETLATVKAANLLLENAYKAQHYALSKFKPNAMALLTEIVTTLLNQSVADNPALILDMVERAMNSLYLTGKVKVVLNPSVIQLLRQLHPLVEDGVNRMNRFEFIADTRLAPEEIFIIGTDGCFNLTPGSQVNMLMDSIAPDIELPEVLPEILLQEEQPEEEVFEEEASRTDSPDEDETDDKR